MNRLARRRDEARLALMLLTRLPVGHVNNQIPMAACFWAYPLAGSVVGLVMGLVLWGAQVLGLTPTVAALLTLAAGLVLTGALHEDGLADAADGFGGGRDPAHRLEIMRDSRIGSYGVLALILACGLRVVLMAELPVGSGTIFALAVIGALSRAILPLMMLALPPARADGVARAAAHGDGKSGAILGLALSTGLAVVLLPLGLAIVLAVALVALGVAQLARARIGGVTGDVLGATQQGCEIVAILILVWALGR